MDKVYKIICNIKLFTTESNHTKGIMGTLSKVTPSRSIMDNIIKMTEKSINSTFRFLCKCQGLALFWEKKNPENCRQLIIVIIYVRKTTWNSNQFIFKEKVSTLNQNMGE